MYHITMKSGNKKTGPLVTVTSPKETCPDSCPFKTGGCYANSGPLHIHWNKISRGTRGVDFQTLISILNNLKDKRVRLWQAGDMPGINSKINFSKIKQLVKACKNVQAFGYTHKPSTIHNKKVIKYCNDHGVTINLSANNLAHSDDLYELNVGPVCTVLPKSSNKKDIYTPKGRKVVVCPANDKLTCNTCGGSFGALCYRSVREYIIGFIAHGTGINRASKIAQGYDRF